MKVPTAVRGLKQFNSLSFIQSDAIFFKKALKDFSLRNYQKIERKSKKLR